MPRALLDVNKIYTDLLGIRRKDELEIGVYSKRLRSDESWPVILATQSQPKNRGITTHSRGTI